MPIKNYTTTIDSFQSLGEIQGALAKNGACKIMIEYEKGGTPVSITFGLNTPNGPQGFMLEANIQGVEAVFQRQRVKADRAQAQRTAWRNVRDWVLAQVAIIESGQMQIDEAFFPCICNGKGTTLYQLYQGGQLQLEAHHE